MGRVPPLPHKGGAAYATVLQGRCTYEISVHPPVAVTAEALPMSLEEALRMGELSGRLAGGDVMSAQTSTIRHRPHVHYST
jgi:hypothetical protein